MVGAGGRFGALGRVLGDGENPLRWGVPLGRVRGVRVRLHWVFVLYALAQVIFTLPRHQAGVVFVVPFLVALLVVVLLHEAGHCVACRRAGGQADEIVLWPLGGLAACRTPHGWRQEMWTALAGPMVNAGLAILLGGVLAGLTGSWSSAAPYLLDPARSIPALEAAYGSLPWWLIALWSLHLANLVVLGFNLLPAPPLDAARVLQAVVWRRAGYHRSLWVSAHAGLVTSGLLVAAGLVLADGKVLLVVGAFTAVVAWMERLRVQFLAGADPTLDPPAARPGPPAEPPSAHAPETDDQDEVDRILEKISRAGMAGLTARERRVLKRATERIRESKGPGATTEQ